MGQKGVFCKILSFRTEAGFPTVKGDGPPISSAAQAQRLKPSGGSVLGHAIGGTGRRILVSLIHEMKKRGL